MKKAIIRIISMSFLLTFLFTIKAEAKWWIFGASEDEVTINYLYLNNASYDELGPKVTVYRETLPNGMIVLKGKASVKKGKIGGVRVTINNKEKWEDAKLSERGDFEYRFKAETGKTYVVYIEVMDTTGKTNDIEATRKEIVISEQNIQTAIKDVLNKMVDAYRRENASTFMTYVSDDFAGDVVNLDRAIRKDFSLFDNIDLRYSINNITSGEKGLVFVSLNYNRMVISAKTGKSYTDKGTTEFVFKIGDKGPKVFSMKNPLIFGLSDAGNVATGVVRLASQDKILVVDDKGNIDTKPFEEAIKIITEEESISEVQSGTFTLETNCSDPSIGIYVCVCSGFIFEEGRVTSGIPPAYGGTYDDYDIYLEINIMFFNTGVTGIDLGIRSINDITEVPATGYTSTPLGVEGNIGRAYAIRLANGKYAVIEVVSYTEISNNPLHTKATFRYKYQPDGSRRF